MEDVREGGMAGVRDVWGRWGVRDIWGGRGVRDVRVDGE